MNVLLLRLSRRSVAGGAIPAMIKQTFTTEGSEVTENKKVFTLCVLFSLW